MGSDPDPTREIGLVIRDIGNFIVEIGEKVQYLGYLIAENDVEAAAERSYDE